MATAFLRLETSAELLIHRAGSTDPRIVTDRRGMQHWREIGGFEVFIFQAAVAVAVGGLKAAEIVCADDEDGTNLRAVESTGPVNGPYVGALIHLTCDLLAVKRTGARYVAGRIVAAHPDDVFAASYIRTTIADERRPGRSFQEYLASLPHGPR